MQVSRVRALRGPNLWSHHTSVEAIVACTPEEECIGNLAGFETRLRARFPALSPLQPTGHNDTIPMAHVFELAALDLQAQAGCPVTFSRTTATLEHGIFQVVVEYSEEAVGRLALELAEQLVRAARDDTAVRPRRRAGAIARARRRRAPRTVHRFDRAGRRGAQHPVPPPDRRQPGDLRLGQPPAQDPGRRNGPHRRHRRVDRAGQGTDQEAARRGRRAGAARARRRSTPTTPGPPRSKSACRW